MNLEWKFFRRVSHWESTSFGFKIVTVGLYFKLYQKGICLGSYRTSGEAKDKALEHLK